MWIFPNGQISALLFCIEVLRNLEGFYAAQVDLVSRHRILSVWSMFLRIQMSSRTPGVHVYNPLTAGHSYRELVRW